MIRTLARRLASAVDQRIRCIDTANTLWEEKTEARILRLVRDNMPSGSGIDNGTTIDLERSTGDKLVFHADYHHMNENGYYDGWTEHTITVKPSFVFGLDITISGRDRNYIKEYLHQCYDCALSEDAEEYADEIGKPLPIGWMFHDIGWQTIEA